MKLRVLPPSPRAIKIVALNNHLQLGSELIPIDYFKEEQKSPAFEALNPNMRQPVLEDDEFILWESNAILHYLAAQRPEAALWPSAPREQADALRWLFWEATHWDPACDTLISERIKKIVFRRGVPDAARIAEGQRTLRDLATILDRHLAGRTWLLGDRLSIADFALGAWFPCAEPAGYSLGDFKAIWRWYDRVQALPGWQAALAPPAL